MADILSVALSSMRAMNRYTLKCGCGRYLVADGRAGRGAYRCGCSARIKVTEEPSSARCCSYGDCRTLATTKEPLKLCPDHEVEAARQLGHLAGTLELQHYLDRSYNTWSRKFGYGLTPLPRNPRHAPVVYFARREYLIKIGTTTQLRERMRAIPAVPLALEPGDVVRETQLHRQFAAFLAMGREWFRPEPDLIAYINKRRKAERLRPLSGAQFT